jgi:hypothetical protein
MRNACRSTSARAFVHDGMVVCMTGYAFTPAGRTGAGTLPLSCLTQASTVSVHVLARSISSRA